VSPLEALLRHALNDLARLGVRGAIIGGLAVSVRTDFRFTKDVDFAVAVADDHEAERVVGGLLGQGYQLLSMLEQTATGRFATARLIVPVEAAQGAVLDLLFASTGIEPEIVRTADQVEVFSGLVAPVATFGHLIALKVLSRNDDTRPQDVIDLRNLMVEAAPDDLRLAEESLALISARGYDRGKNLRAEYEQLLARFRPTS
jgi:predicted nucleotidyltransferase